MPFVLLLIGLIAAISAYRGTYADLGTQLSQDLKGSAGNVGYIYWVSAIVFVGAIGYYTPAQRFSRAFILLILLGMVLSNQGFFVKLQQALKNPVETSPSQSGTTQAQSTPQQTSQLQSGVQSLASAGEMLTEFSAAFV